MSPTVVIIGAVAIIAYTIGSQIMGTAIRAKRLIVLPGILAVIGVVNLAGSSVHPDGADIGLIAIGSAVAAVTGISLGLLMRLEQRDGWLWGQLPRRGLWLWAAFFASRGILLGVAHATGAHVASGTHAELLILGINRLGQALVIGARAVASGVPFAPEKDGSRPFGGMFASGSRSSADAPSSSPVVRPDVTEPPAAPDPFSALPRSRRQARRARRGRLR